MSGLRNALQHYLCPLHVQCAGVRLAEYVGGTIEIFGLCFGVIVGKLAQGALIFLAEVVSHLWEPVYKRLPWIGRPRRTT